MPEVRRLSARELQVLRGVAAGHTNGQIGRDAGVTADTVKWHVAKLCRRLGVGRRAALAAWAALNLKGD